MATPIKPSPAGSLALEGLSIGGAVPAANGGPHGGAQQALFRG